MLYGALGPSLDMREEGRRALDSFYGKIIVSSTNNSQAKADDSFSASGNDERSAKALASTSFKEIPSSSCNHVPFSSSNTEEKASDSIFLIKEGTNPDPKDKKLGDIFSQLWIQFLQLNVDKLAAFIDGSDSPLKAQNTVEEEPGSPIEAHSNLEQASLDKLALVESFAPIQAIYPLVENSQYDHSSVRAYHSDSEIYVKEDNIAFLPFFRDQTEFDPDPEPYREWYPDDGIEPDDHLRRWGGPKGLMAALIRNNDEGRIIFERGCVCGSSPPAPRRSLRLARRRQLPSPIRSECSIDTGEYWGS
ncbi:unnamed protein product [Cuscuta campestris]|uniref:Uncharacterized protein n=1 Tax=Cuscuta campestris TaxID=132261 RepID=A0A484MQM6_9ASTE|nr:unnamed protein product [Cuscuta campestris]